MGLSVYDKVSCVVVKRGEMTAVTALAAEEKL
jgi:hypothetical protein